MTDSKNTPPPIQGSGVRRLPSLIGGFLDYTASLTSPEIFRRWAAIGMISAVMERKVWTVSGGGQLYPNLYMVLVGGPGSGKSEALKRVEDILRHLPDFHVAPSSMTTASLADNIRDAKRHIVQPALVPPFLEFNSLTAVASELGVFLPVYEPSFMNMLTKLFDGEHYSESRRSVKDKLVVEKPLLTILGGTTPSYLNTSIPLVAWDQGFTSRTIFVFSGEQIVTDPWAEVDSPRLDRLRTDIIADVKQAYGLVGHMSWERDAMDALRDWHLGGRLPKPTHEKLQHYEMRRLIQLLKLCMVASVARNNYKVVTMQDYQTALGWLLEAEALMPEIFRAAATTEVSAAINEAYWFLQQTYSRGGKPRPVPEHQFISFLATRIPSYSVKTTIELMEAAKYFKVDYDKGQKMLTPLEKPNRY